MVYAIYALAVLFLLWGIAGFMGWLGSKRIGILMASVVCVGASLASYQLQALWPLIVGLVVLWLLRRLGFDPGWKSNGPYDFNDDNGDI